MNSTDLIAITRLNALLEPTSVDYTDSAILRELNNALTTKFERAVTDADCGYWMQSIVYSTTPGKATLRLPPRACGLSKIEISTTGSQTIYSRLPQVQEGHAELFYTAAGSTGFPQAYVLRGNNITLFPPPADVYNVRLWYFIRPSTLVQPQPSISGFTAGYVFIVNQTTRTLTVPNLGISIYAPDGSSTALASGDKIDVVSTGGWRELCLVGEVIASQTATTIVLGGTSDMSNIAVGDCVRPAEQHEWPCLPEDFHRTLADVAAVKILIQRDFQAKAGGYAQDANADMKRFTDMISNRVVEEPRTVRSALPSLRRGWR